MSDLLRSEARSLNFWTADIFQHANIFLSVHMEIKMLLFTYLLLISIPIAKAVTTTTVSFIL